MNIVFCLDKNMLNCLKVIINSILENTDRQVNFYVICPEKENIIFANYIINNINAKINVGNFNPSQQILDLLEPNTYYNDSKLSNFTRLNIKKVFPELKKIIYLDTDMVVLDDIGELWDSVEFDENNFFASPQYNWLFYFKIFYFKKLDYYFSYLNSNTKFFNGGVFLTDLTYWDENLDSKIYDHTHFVLNHKFTHQFTEPIMNGVFDNFIPLESSWNCSGYGNKNLYPLIKLRDFNIIPKIIHWSGPTKPWHFNDVYKQELWNYYNNEMIIENDDDYNLFSWIKFFIIKAFNLFKYKEE